MLGLISTPLVAGQPAEVVVSGATPGAEVHLLASGQIGGVPLCPAVIAPDCLVLSAPVRRLGLEAADAAGSAVFSLTVPMSLPAQVQLQAAESLAGGGGDTSVAPILTVHGPDSDIDADGLNAAQELLIGTDPEVADTDGGGVGDGAEVFAGTDPLDPADDIVPDTASDTGVAPDTGLLDTDVGGPPPADLYVDAARPDDLGDGRSEETAKQTIAGAFAVAVPGDIIEVLPGTYLGGWNVPSFVTMRSRTIGTVLVTGGAGFAGAIGRMTNTGSTLDGLIFTGSRGVANAQTLKVSGSDNTVRNCGIEGPPLTDEVADIVNVLGVSGTGHLIEDCWAWGKGRYLFSTFTGSGSTFRRNFARHTENAGVFPSEPNGSYINYDADDMIWENNLSLDTLQPANAVLDAGDFGMASNVDSGNDNVKFLGNMAVNHWQGVADDGLGNLVNNNWGIKLSHKFGSVGNDIQVIDHYTRNAYRGASYNVFVGTWTNLVVTRVTVDDPQISPPGEDGNLLENGGPITYTPGPANWDAYYKDGVYVDDSVWQRRKHEALIKSRLAAYDIANFGAPQGWAASPKSLEDYMKGR